MKSLRLSFLSLCLLAGCDAPFGAAHADALPANAAESKDGGCCGSDAEAAGGSCCSGAADSKDSKDSKAACCSEEAAPAASGEPKPAVTPAPRHQ